MQLSRRRFLTSLGAGAAAGLVSLAAPAPVRRFWQVPRGAPVKGPSDLDWYAVVGDDGRIVASPDGVRWMATGIDDERVRPGHGALDGSPPKWGAMPPGPSALVTGHVRVAQPSAEEIARKLAMEISHAVRDRLGDFLGAAPLNFSDSDEVKRQVLAELYDRLPPVQPSIKASARGRLVDISVDFDVTV